MFNPKHYPDDDFNHPQMSNDEVWAHWEGYCMAMRHAVQRLERMDSVHDLAQVVDDLKRDLAAQEARVGPELSAARTANAMARSKPVEDSPPFPDPF